MAKKTTKKKATKKKAAKKATKKTTSTSGNSRRQRREKPFPTMPLEDALLIASTIESEAAGQPMRRLTLFDTLGKSPDSGPSRSLITASTKYGLTTGSYTAAELKLTELGKKIVSEQSRPRIRKQAEFDAAISGIQAFKSIHEKFVNGKLPSESVLQDFLRDTNDIPDDLVQECIDTFVVNAKHVGILKEIAGAERLLPIDHTLEELPAQTSTQINPSIEITDSIDAGENADATDSAITDWNTTCFYVTPIGEKDSDLRRHSDLFLEHIVEPALSKLNINVVRADKIGKPGMITKRVLEFVLRSRLVVADLSFHNPNVFYELSLRHACGLPAIQIIRDRDRIPFDLKDFDTIQIDDSSVYSLIPKLEVYRSQLATQARAAIEDDATVDNPILTYFPNLQVTLPGAM